METKPQTKSGSNRLEYLDWVRGLGAAVMLQGHVFQSYLKPELKEGGPYLLSQFLGGMPLAFLMDSTERKGVAPVERVTTSLRRAAYLFGLAFAFRLQLWIFGIPAPWHDLFRVDVLNCM